MKQLLWSIFALFVFLPALCSQDAPAATQTTTCTEKDGTPCPEWLHKLIGRYPPTADTPTALSGFLRRPPSDPAPAAAAAAPALAVLRPTTPRPENANIAKTYPHPYIEGSFDLEPSGYAAIGGHAAAGVDVEEKKFIFAGFAEYDIARKDNDGTVGNRKGRQRYLESRAYYKLGNGWFAGPGFTFTELSTTNYQKTQDELGFWVGRDLRSYPFRLEAQYLQAFNERTRYPDAPGCKCGNGTKAVEFNFWYPSPASNHHFFYKMTIEPFFFHATITDPADPVLTAQQKGNHSFAAMVSYALVARF